VIDSSSVERVVLRNGLTVLVQSDRSAPAVAIVTYVKAGYFDERDEESGISHVLEHMYFKGTPTRGVGDIARETKAAGGYLNAHTIYDNTAYYTVLPATALVKGLEIQFDAYANSAIDAAELEKEIGVIIEEAKRKADNPSAVATETLFELLHDRHRIRRWRIGREKGLRAFTRDMVVSFYRNFYRPGNTILSISGAVDPAATVDTVTAMYGALPPGEPEIHPGPSEPDRTGFRYREMSGDIGQSEFIIGWRTPGAMHADTAALDFASAILSAGRASRLYRSVRERRLAVAISTANHTPVELGVLTIHGEAEPVKTLEALRASWNEALALTSGEIAPSEIERVKSGFEARWARRVETAEGTAMHLAEWEAMGGWELGEDYRTAFLSIAAIDVKRVAERYLTRERAAVLVYRPDSANPVAADEREMFALLSVPSEITVNVVMQSATASKVPAKRVRIELEREEAGVHVFRTPGGIPVLVRRKPGPITYLALRAAGGAVHDTPSRAGLSVLATRTMLKGTRTRSAEQIAEETESIGATLGSSAGHESFGWWMSVPVRRFEEAAELFSDVIINPSFPEKALDTERSVAVAHLALVRDDMFRYPVRLASSAAFEGHPYGLPFDGTEESLSAIAVEQLHGWHFRNVQSSSAAIGVVGDIAPDEAAAVIAAYFGDLTFAKHEPISPPSWPATPTETAESRDKAQTAIALAFPGPSRRNERRFAAHLLSGISSDLGGRFFEELRGRRSLAYTVHVGVRTMQLAGLFIGYIGTSPDKEDAAREGLLGEFERLRESPVGADELDRAREYLIGSHAIARESGGAVLGEMLDAWLFGTGLSEITGHDDMLRAVTAADIQSVACDFFSAPVVEGVVRGVTRTV